MSKKTPDNRVSKSGNDRSVGKDIKNFKNKKSLLEEQSYEKDCINESKDIEKRFFFMAVMFLLVGCLIAFIGIAVSCFLLFSVISSTDLDLTQRLLDYLPRFGILFFIEYIAFFFLKLSSKIMFEEYRYYEAIKRERQDNFIFAEKYKDNPELLKSRVEKETQPTIKRLANGETTGVLETQRIVNQDMDFSKFMDKFLGLMGIIAKSR